MTSPTAPARPRRRLLATSFRVKPRRSMATSTRAAVSSRTPPSPLTTRDTVLTLTPAVRATSRMVGLATLALRPPSDNDVGARGRTLPPLTTLSSTGQAGTRSGGGAATGSRARASRPARPSGAYPLRRGRGLGQLPRAGGVDLAGPCGLDVRGPRRDAGGHGP